MQYTNKEDCSDDGTRTVEFWCWKRLLCQMHPLAHTSTKTCSPTPKHKWTQSYQHTHTHVNTSAHTLLHTHMLTPMHIHPPSVSLSLFPFKTVELNCHWDLSTATDIHLSSMLPISIVPIDTRNKTMSKNKTTYSIYAEPTRKNMRQWHICIWATNVHKDPQS